MFSRFKYFSEITKDIKIQWTSKNLEIAYFSMTKLDELRTEEFNHGNIESRNSEWCSSCESNPLLVVQNRRLGCN